MEDIALHESIEAILSDEYRLRNAPAPTKNSGTGESRNNQPPPQEERVISYDKDGRSDDDDNERTDKEIPGNVSCTRKTGQVFKTHKEDVCRTNATRSMNRLKKDGESPSRCHIMIGTPTISLRNGNITGRSPVMGTVITNNAGSVTKIPGMVVYIRTNFKVEVRPQTADMIRTSNPRCMHLDLEKEVRGKIKHRRLNQKRSKDADADLLSL